ncbi:sigma-70 family RNA polymerase sigma factor [Engelhardtia mirabilis]|uniref:ECF RNA polymerase sigma factor SigE n=1 Tax=Engelhardtia mirabilis TaxID=2528011 RepID=A0A518BFQ1_9BACT|nr:ECF RNA polymerase sigma factor SigE [Planctomycetes bacterium Pla133]QDV00135.1 ECF RNA polymerase sigma factor SigE [Planctomycetes bacterium Pla86]
MKRRPQRRDFEALVHAHHEAVYRSALRLLTDDAAARDVTQEVFLRVLEGKLVIAEPDRARQILCWWSVRAALDARRGAERRRRREQEHALERSPSEDRDPIETADGLAQLRALLAELPEELRLPLVLRTQEGLGYARIGEALDIAESTAHGRVERALERLRRGLVGAGLPAALAVDLEGSLARAQPIANTAGLAESLLGLEAPIAAGGLWAWAIGLPVAAGLALGVATLGRGDGREDPKLAAMSSPAAEAEPAAIVEVASLVDPTGTASIDTPATGSRRELATAGPADAVQVPIGTARGQVLDADGVPVADCEVTVASVERVGKQPRFSATALTDSSGRFEAEVALADAAGGLYRLHARRAQLSIQRSEVARILPEQVTDFGLLRAKALLLPEVGAFDLSIEVVGPDGAPIPDLRLDLASQRPLADGGADPISGWHARADWAERNEVRLTTDGSGLAYHRGSLLGSKVLRVVDPQQRFAPAMERFEVADGDPVSLTIQLDRGLEIAGTVRTVDGVIPDPSGVLLTLVSPTTGEQRFAAPDDLGRFRIAGLEPGAHRIHVGNDLAGIEGAGWSTGSATVVAGDEALELRIKRADDPRDLGLHGAELHGRVRLAADDSPAIVDPWDLDLLRIDLPEGSDFELDWLPTRILPAPAQKMMMQPIPEPSDRFHLQGLAEGRYLLRLARQDDAPAFLGPIELGEGEVRHGLTLKLEPGGTLVGTVVDGHGDPVADAVVIATGAGPLSDAAVQWIDERLRLTDGRERVLGHGAVRTDERGRFGLTELPAGVAFHAVALHPAARPTVGPRCVLEAGESGAPIQLRLEPR